MNRKLDSFNVHNSEQYIQVWRGKKIYDDDGHNNLVNVAQKVGNFSYIDRLIINYYKQFPSPFNSVVSIGCGLGKDLQTVKRINKGSEVYGIDTSPDVLAKAQKELPDGNFICASATHLPFRKDAKFDTVIIGQCDNLNEEDVLKNFKHRKTMLYFTFFDPLESDNQLLYGVEFENSRRVYSNLLRRLGWNVLLDEPYNFSSDAAQFAKGGFLIAKKQ